MPQEPVTPGFQSTQPPTQISPPPSKSLADLLENPAFSNMVRIFIVVVLALGSFLWKSEMGHLNRALSEIKLSMSENNSRQRQEVSAIRSEVTRMTRDLHGWILQTQQLLLRGTADNSGGFPRRYSSDLSPGVNPSSNYQPSSPPALGRAEGP